MPKGTEEAHVEIWFQDEHRIGQQGSLTRIWARKGTRPRAPRQQQFISAYIFGAVCPEKDKGAAVIIPQANTASMQAHIDEIVINKSRKESMRLSFSIKQVGILQRIYAFLRTFLFCHCLLTLLS